MHDIFDINETHCHLVEAEVAAQLQRELVLLVEAEEGVEVEAEQLVPAPAAGPRHPGVLEHQDINTSRQQSQSGWGWAGRKASLLEYALSALHLLLITYFILHASPRRTFA